MLPTSFNPNPFLKINVTFLILASLAPTPLLSATAEPGRRLQDLSINGATVTGDLPVHSSVTVANDGSGDFTTIADAISFAPTNIDTGYFIIQIKEGLYKEHVVIRQNKKNLMLIGQGIGKTVVTGDRSQRTGWSLMDTSTFIVLGDGFVAMNMSFRNTAGLENHQAVALTNSADRSTFFQCSFEGYQDTLYVRSAAQFYRDCDIYGNKDFIFGDAAAVFQNCNIYVRGAKNAQHTSIITAQSREGRDEKTGICIHGCKIMATPADHDDEHEEDQLDKKDPNKYTLSTFLGRPWKAYSRTVFMQSYIDNIIDPLGWRPWNESSPVDKVFYGEYNNDGPGASTSKRVKWPGFHILSDSQALSFTADNFINANAWVPTAVVPLHTGLL